MAEARRALTSISSAIGLSRSCASSRALSFSARRRAFSPARATRSSIALTRALTFAREIPEIERGCNGADLVGEHALVALHLGDAVLELDACAERHAQFVQRL